MRARKRYLTLPENEWRIVLLALNRLRSKLMAQERYPDAVPFPGDSKRPIILLDFLRHQLS